jgi:hypothetical protein
MRDADLQSQQKKPIRHPFVVVLCHALPQAGIGRFFSPREPVYSVQCTAAWLLSIDAGFVLTQPVGRQMISFYSAVSVKVN